MGVYRLSNEARADLARVYHHGLERFGEAQADRYYERLVQRFEELVAHPLAYPTVDDIRDGYRRSVCGADTIFYRLSGDDVEIMAIIGRQDLDSWL